jgi:hypothetical protein
MSMSPRETLRKLNDVLHAWRILRPSKSFGGMTLEQFGHVIQASIDVRTEIDHLDAKRASLVARRETLDALSLDAAALAVHGVKGDPEEGEDGELYGSMGFVRKSERRSGLTRRRARAQAEQAKESDREQL